MRRSCDICGKRYEAKRQNSKYCSGNCGQRAYRLRQGQKARSTIVAISTDAPEPTDEQGPVEASTLQVLTACERETTPLGLSVLAMSRRIDAGFDTGAGLAALVKQFESTLRTATSGALDEQSALDKARDDLAVRREARSA